MMKTTVAAFAAVAACAATNAFAQPIPAQDLIVQSIDLTVEGLGGTPIQFDLDGDGFNDFQIEIFEPFFDDQIGRQEGNLGPVFLTEAANISGLSNSRRDGTMTSGRVAVVDLLDVASKEAIDSLFIEQLPGDGFVATFDVGDDVGPGLEREFIDTPTSDLPFTYERTGVLYVEGEFEEQLLNQGNAEDVAADLIETEFGVSDGPFAVEGATAFIGLQVNTEALSFAEEVHGAPIGGTTFGWAQITRGSITVGQIGFQPGGGSANVAPVPVPPALGLLLGGLALIGFIGRRRAAA